RFLTEALTGLAPSITTSSTAMATTAKPNPGVAGTNSETRLNPGFASATPETLDSASAYARPNRVSITPERLLAALQPKIEKAAETAILSAVSKHLAPAVHAAVNSIDAAREASVQQVSNATAQQRSTLVHTSREELLARLEDRLDEVRIRWDAQLEGYRIRAEEIVQRIDRQAGATQKNLGDALAALDAEHRAACDTRRKSIESDIARSTEQVTEQFRQGLRAFFYSCLVAAVGAVEQHSQTTREGFSLDAKNFLPPQT